KDFAILDDDVAHVDADTQLDAVVGRHAGVAAGHFALHLDRAAQRVHHTAELDEQPVAGGLDEAAAMFGDLWIQELATQCSETFWAAAPTGAGRPGTPRHIGGEDRG